MTAALLAALACSNPISETPTLRVSSLGEVQPAGLEVTVTAADLPHPLVFHSGAVNSVYVPPGRARTFNARALDESGRTTHAGAALLDVGREEETVTLVVLRPRIGTEPIALRIGPVNAAAGDAALRSE
jgi:hypothetical protein